MVLTVRMNETAASALQPPAIVDPPPAVPRLSQGLRDKLAEGLAYNEGAWIFAEHVGQWMAAPASASAAIAKMGRQDLPGYEWHVNAFHLEDHAPTPVHGLRPQPGRGTYPGLVFKPDFGFQVARQFDEGRSAADIGQAALAPVSRDRHAPHGIPAASDRGGSVVLRRDTR